MKIWIALVCVYILGVSAQSDEAGLLDYWADDYDDQWYQDELEKLGIVTNEKKDSPEDTNNFNDYDNVGKQEQAEDEMDKKVEEEIQKFEPNDSKDDDTVNDYQVEDNRSEQRIEDVIEKKTEEKAELIHDNDDANNAKDENLDSYDDYNGDDGAIFAPSDDVDDNREIEFSKDDELAPLPLPPQSSDEVKQILEETNDILNEEEQQPNDFAEDSGETKYRDDMKDIIDETKQILLETNDQFDEEVKSEQLDKPEPALEKESVQDIDSEEEKNIFENLSDNIVASEEDSLDKAYQDLNEDLDTLFETLNKIANSEDIDDQAEPNVDYAVHSDENIDIKSDYESIFDSNLSEIFAQHSKDMEETIKESPQDVKEASESIDDLAEVDVDEKKPVPYVDDALVSNDDEKSVKSVNEDDLNDDQLLKLMEEFAVQHSDALNADAYSENHIVNEMSLEYGEELVIESENYPSGYPTNRVVDWIITGDGVGIELNVTDFAVNSALGDYLLVKPGQNDASGEDGLIFAYHLNEPKAYRFLDVDRLFLRFDAKNGFSLLKGFSLTVSMIAPLPADPESLPEPEPILPEPRSTLTIILGGLPLQNFTEIKEDFRLLVADMATMYINANRIEPGLNTTAEITQITTAHVCNVHWPGYEQCAMVRVAVPLVYEESEQDRLTEQELEHMWNTYVKEDPFAERLWRMGIEEFSVPNDASVMTVWLVVTLGVLVSAAMLALALWRYSCFKDYSRMPAFSDTDSLNEKPGLDLYPTPHQTLPPLYSENEYKWEKYDDSSRVDMGGLANRSYVRTDMYDMESDEEVPRDRSASIQPRDIYSM